MPAYQLTTAWQKVASAGQTVEVENLSVAAALIMTSSGGPPSTPDGIMLIGEHPAERYALTLDLYARSLSTAPVTLEVMSGFSLGTTTPGTSAGSSPAGVADFSQASNSALVGAFS